jgi:excisionase family DNA binding protein
MQNDAAGYTVADLAKRFRVGKDKVRAWIRRGELSALNTADWRCGRPRYVVTAEGLTDFERRRRAALSDAPKPKRRKKSSDFVDFYPD